MEWEPNSEAWYGGRILAIRPLFDGDLGVWLPKDFGLVENLSEVAYWSREDDFAGLLAA